MKNIKSLFNIHFATYILILTYFMTGLIKNIILIYLIVIVHELGHIFIIKKLKYKIIRVDIFPMGGVTTLEKKVNTPIKDEILIASFGFIFQVILWLIFYLLSQMHILSLSTYELFLNYNKVILIFNMIPIIPLDGYHFLRGLLEIWWPFKKAYYWSFGISTLFIVLLITYNEIFSLNNYLIITFLIYKIVTSWKDFKYVYLKFLMERHLYDLHYDKVNYEKRIDISLLKKDTYHYFKDKGAVYSEKSILKRKFSK